MKCFLWLAFFLVGPPLLIAQASYGTIEGTVVRFGTSEPIPNVSVFAQSEVSGRSREPALRAQTDQQGRFRLEKVLPGQYRIAPQSIGYSLPSQGGELITARDGELVRNVRLSLVRDGAIHGRVIPPNGRLLTGVEVELVTGSVVVKGPRVLKFSGKAVAVGENGEYQLTVVPGEYYVRTATQAGAPLARTYFPNTSEPGDAKPIRVGQGEDVAADIQLSTTPVFKITGRIIDLVPDLEPHYISGVSLSSDSATVREYKLENLAQGLPFCCAVGVVPDSNVSVTVSNDRFEIQGVRPGSYALAAGVLVGAVKPGEFVVTKLGDSPPYSVRYSGLNAVTVTNADIADVEIEVRRGMEVKGRIVSNGAPVETKGVTLFLRGPDYDPNSSMLAETDDAGRFTFHNLSDGVYMIDPLHLPGDAYVEEVLQAGRKLSDLEFAVNKSDSDPLEFIVNPSGGTVSGQITDSSHALIALVPVEGQAGYVASTLGRSRATGEFEIRGVAPGNYRMFAFDAPSIDEVLGNIPLSDFVRLYPMQGTALTVKSGARTTLRLSLIDSIVK